LGADNDIVPIADGGIDHGVTYDLEHVELAFADEGCREREDLFHLLLRKDWCTGRDATDERDGVGLGDLGPALRELLDLNRSASGGVAADEALGFQLA
jgi:hypothetical protein